MAQVLSIKKSNAAVVETIALNDTQMDIEKARFDYQAKVEALQAEFRQRADALKLEYHATLAGITAAE